MPLFDWPTPEEVWAASALRPEQISAPSQDSAVAAAGLCVTQAGPIVERRILAATSPQYWPFATTDLAVALPKYTDAQRSARQDDQIGVAQKAIQLMALHYLYDRAGQLNKAYQDKANEYKGDAEMILTGSVDGTGMGGLLGELSQLAGDIGAGTGDQDEAGPGLLFVPAYEPGKHLCDEFGGFFC